MICQNCGQLFEGNFCPNCGFSIVAQCNTDFQPRQTPAQRAAGKFFIGVGIACIIAMVPLLFLMFAQDNGRASNVGIFGGSTPSDDISVISISAKDLLGEYDRNQVAADKKYSGAILSVRGVVNNIGMDIADDVYVTVGTGAEYELYSVQCYFSSEEAIAEVANLLPGDAVTVVGICEGKLLNVTLEDCKLS